MSILEKPVMLLKTDSRDTEWVKTFGEIAPEIEMRIWPDVGDPKEINCALLWAPPAELFASLENLEVIFSIGAGVDSLLRCPGLPTGVPIVRMVEPQLTAGMVEYCLFNVLRFHRLIHLFERQQRAKHWEELTQRPAPDVTVGIMGLGKLGEALARQLKTLNYRLIGYRRSAVEIEGVEIFHGADQVKTFLGRAEILVLLMPATQETRHILNEETLAYLPAGAFVINAGRGDLIDEPALLRALDSGHLGGAALDVFEQEPLPEDNPLWNHPKVLVTPHIGSITFPPTACRYIADAIRDHTATGQWPNRVKTEAGY